MFTQFSAFVLIACKNTNFSHASGMVYNPEAVAKISQYRNIVKYIETYDLVLYFLNVHK